MVVHASNVAAALLIAIGKQSEQEKKLGYSGESSQLAGWRTMLAALRNGEPVIIQPADPS